MSRQLFTRSWLGQSAVMAAALMVFALGFCLFDSDGMNGHGMASDLCAGMLVSSLALLLLAGPLANGRLVLDPARSAYVVSLHIPDPPPKSRSLA